MKTFQKRALCMKAQGNTKETTPTCHRLAPRPSSLMFLETFELLSKSF